MSKYFDTSNTEREFLGAVKPYAGAEAEPELVLRQVL
jgi:hypothetical protein